MGFDIRLVFDRGVPIYRQIYEAVAAALAGGALERGEQLPTIQELAGRLGVNPNTVARAYRELERDSYITGRRGVGTFSSEESAVPEAPPAERRQALRSIFERALVEASRYGIGIDELKGYFRKAKS